HAEAPQARITSKISAALYSLQLDGVIEQVGWMDKADIKLLVVRHHSVATYLDMMSTNVSVSKAIIIAGTIDELNGGQDYVGDIGFAKSNVDRLFRVSSYVMAENQIGLNAMKY